MKIKNNQKETIIGIHGGGCIGLGLMGDIINKSSLEDFHIYATSNDYFFNAIINSQNAAYFQCFNSNETCKLNNITMISRDRDNIIDLYTYSQWVALCLTPGAFDESVESIAFGLIRRYELTKAPLNLLILMNLQDSAEHIQQMLEVQLNKLTTEEYAFKVLEFLNLVPAVPDRVVTKVTAEDARTQLVAELKREQCSSMEIDNLINQLDNISPQNEDTITALIKNHKIVCSLFNAEQNFRLYVPKSATFLTSFSELEFVDDIKLFQIVKNKYINGPHTILAWLGALIGCSTVTESIKYPGMESFIRRLMNQEIAPILKNCYPQLSEEKLVKLQELFIKRCYLNKDDTTSRVGRNPLSKLDFFGRVLGTINLRKAYGLPLRCLEMGVAAGVVYALKNCSTDEGCLVREIYEANNQSYEAILCYKDEVGRVGLDPIKNAEIIARILNNIQLLSSTPERFLEMQPLIQTLNFFSKSNNFRDNIMRIFCNKSGININKQTGQLIYADNFVPLQLNFELGFVRHGETFGNAGQSTAEGKINFEAVEAGIRSHDSRIFQGNVDEEINQLTERGIEQAKTAAELLFDLGWIPDIIFHSPLKRAKDTGQPFVELLQKNNILREYKELSTIRELSFGAWENRRVSDFPREHLCHQFYLNQNALVAENGNNVYGQYCEGESFYQVLLRAREVLINMNSSYAGRKVLMYSHSMFGAACLILTGKGQCVENGNYLAFDGKKSNNESYTIPNATPYIFNQLPEYNCSLRLT